MMTGVAPELPLNILTAPGLSVGVDESVFGALMTKLDVVPGRAEAVGAAVGYAVAATGADITESVVADVAVVVTNDVKSDLENGNVPVAGVDTREAVVGGGLEFPLSVSATVETFCPGFVPLADIS